MSRNRFFCRIVELRSQWDAKPQLPFSELLTEDHINALLHSLGQFYRDRLYSPCVTLWVFLSQVLSPDQSCLNAVSRLLAFRTARGLPACSTRTGSYCTARQRLPEPLLAQLTRQTGRELAQQAPAAWRLQGRTIKLVDGSTVSMPDTPQNEAAFGKPSNQQGRCAFPVARIVGLLCLATGAALELAIGPYRGKRSGEMSLFRELQPSLETGDIVLGDRLFCSYCDLARLAARGVDAVFRLSAQRFADFRRGHRLGRDDHLAEWHKPVQRPDWLTPEEFAAVPGRLWLREVRVRIAIPGFRVRQLVVVTTLTDPRQFSGEDIAGLFRQRWQAELDLRSIKSVLQMDVLRCLTPQMVRKELWVHLLAYNLLRSVMCAAADESGLLVRELSFKGTLQLLNGLYPHLLLSAGEVLSRYCETLLSGVRQHRVGNRPDRFEPRKRKRAAKAYPPLKRPRSQERKQCL
jgi:hypothetical protein